MSTLPVKRVSLLCISLIILTLIFNLYNWHSNLHDDIYGDVLMNTHNNDTNGHFKFGIILLAYSDNEKMVEKYLNETNNLCKNILSIDKAMKVSLFTIELFHDNWRNNYSKVIDICTFDQIIFIDKSGTQTRREFATRISLLKETPYNITMSLDSDFYVCNDMNIDALISQIINENIDFSYTAFKRGNVPQGGLFLYSLNNKTKHLFNKWQEYHSKHHMYDDQDSLQHTIKQLDKDGYDINIYLLNNRYNYRLHGPKINFHNQMAYPNNEIIMFHNRDFAHHIYHQQLICQELNKYDDKLRMIYHWNGSVFSCFHSITPKCIEWAKFTKKPNVATDYQYFWSNTYHCQWNQSIDFVSLKKDTCLSR